MIPTWRRALATVGGIVLGAVLLVAAWAKTLDPIAFAGQIRAEGLDFLLPAGVVALIALALEWGLGVGLLVGLRQRWIVWTSSALVAFFVFLTGRTYWRHLRGVEPDPDASCGCFGNLVERTPTEAFWQDMILLVPPMLLVWLAVEVGRRPPIWRLVLVGFFTIAGTLVAWRAPDLPLDDLATRLSPGTDAMTICAGSDDPDAPGGSSRVCLDAILPEIASGDHLVVIADIEAPAFTERIAELNDFAWRDGAPTLWAVAAATEDQLFQLRFGHGPVFEVREAPKPLLRPLYRTLPRTFRVVDGLVTETYAGLPPLDALAGTDTSESAD
ncbi:MAG: MauE/DoxX family redox-associated membrane protein [Acidobacteriota bacterium]